MYKITSNDWDGMKFNTVKDSVKRSKTNNKKMREVAEKYASKGRDNPSPLEKAMMEFLNSHHVKYEFQKPCCIYKNNVITQFFIIDFYIPNKKIIIETDGKFHDAQLEYDDYRTKMIKRQHPRVNIIRWRFKNFHSVEDMKKLLNKIA